MPRVEMESVDIRRCLHGDADAWCAFVTRYTPVVHAAVNKTISRHGTGSARAETEDVVQDVFLRLVKDDFKAMRSYDPARASIVTWLTVVARSVAIDHVRRLLPPHAAIEDVPEPTMTRPEAVEVNVRTGVLSPRQELVLHLLYQMDMGVAEVAQALGVAEQTVRSTRHKAISALRRVYEENGRS